MKSLLEKKELLLNEQIITSDLAIYEVANAIWKHEHLLKSLANGKEYINIFYGLIESGKIAILSSNESILQQSYLIAGRNNITVYDAVFVALALELDLPLETMDKAQVRAFNSENNGKMKHTR